MIASIFTKLGTHLKRPVFLTFLLLVCSAGIRIFLHADTAVAQIFPDSGALTSPATGSPSPKDADGYREASEMLILLQKKEAEISERERRLNRRSKALELSHKEVDRRINALEEAESKLRAILALADVAAENDIEKLIAMYEQMKPKQAATLFQEMDAEFAAGFLARMKPVSAANILAGLEPSIAYSISAILAGRNATVPSN